MDYFKTAFEKQATLSLKTGREFVQSIARKRAANAIQKGVKPLQESGTLNYNVLKRQRSAMNLAERQQAWRNTPAGKRITVDRYPSMAEKTKTRIPETRRNTLFE